MRGARAALAVAALTLLASCASHDPFYDTALARKKIEISQADDIYDLLIVNPDRDRSSIGYLADAAFALVEGMDRASAIRTFEADGATCTGSSCLWTGTDREDLECFLPLLSGFCMREPGPRRSWLTFHEVTLEADPIRSRADISVRTWSEEVLPGG